MGQIHLHGDRESCVQFSCLQLTVINKQKPMHDKDLELADSTADAVERAC